jgi:transposase
VERGKEVLEPEAGEKRFISRQTVHKLSAVGDQAVRILEIFPRRVRRGGHRPAVARLRSRGAVMVPERICVNWREAPRDLPRTPLLRSSVNREGPRRRMHATPDSVRV